MMSNAEIEEFAQLLMRDVRDRGIRDCDNLASPRGAGPIARRWREAADAAGGTIPAAVAIPDCVDQAIANLLRAVDDGTIRLQYVSKSGKVVDLTQEGLGELTGWFMGSDGWRAKYSKQRYVDDFADLKL